MKVKFFGTRGSIPVCNPEFQEFGGNTTCVQLILDGTNNVGILDAGTGIRNLGKEILQSSNQPDNITILFSHFHWDHIQGFPFFDPAYKKNQKISLVSLGPEQNVKELKEIFKTQMHEEYFPVQLDNMGADFKFLLLDKPMEIMGVENKDIKPVLIIAHKHNHPGGAYSFRIEHEDKVLVFCTDVEHGDKIDQAIVTLSEEADLLIHEAQYTTEELKSKKGWGHSSFEQAIEVAELANVKMLAMTHHDPDHDDEFLKIIESKCQESFNNCFLAREQMVIEV